MSEFTFKLEQEDADEFSLLIEDGEGCVWRVPMRMSDAVALHEAVDAGIGDYVRERRNARRAFEREALRGFDAIGDGDPPGVDSFEGHGDFNSDDPMERYIAHQAAKGNL